jgi:hypothetical protein
MVKLDYSSIKMTLPKTLGKKQKYVYKHIFLKQLNLSFMDIRDNHSGIGTRRCKGARNRGGRHMDPSARSEGLTKISSREADGSPETAVQSTNDSTSVAKLNSTIIRSNTLRGNNFRHALNKVARTINTRKGEIGTIGNKRVVSSGRNVGRFCIDNFRQRHLLVISKNSVNRHFLFTERYFLF